MILTDFHSHVADSHYAEDRNIIFENLEKAGVGRLIMVLDPSTDSIDEAMGLLDGRDYIRLAFGVHPHEASKYTPELERELLRLLKHPCCRFLGEIGLDYHYDFSPRALQREVFARQLDLAYELGMPVQLHIREAHGDCEQILREAQARGRLPSGAFHCFSGSSESAMTYLSMGFYISFSGSVTFKNAEKLRLAAMSVPEDRILTETDCPYMSPVPMRGRRNEPANVRYTLEKIAELKGLDEECLAETIRLNCDRLMGEL